MSEVLVITECAQPDVITYRHGPLGVVLPADLCRISAPRMAGPRIIALACPSLPQETATKSPQSPWTPTLNTELFLDSLMNKGNPGDFFPQVALAFRVSVSCEPRCASWPAAEHGKT